MNDGGPAFPWEQSLGNQDNLGLSKRDWFAGMALQGMLSNPECFKSIKERKLDKASAAENHADYAYFMADAMLKEREKHE